MTRQHRLEHGRRTGRPSLLYRGRPRRAAARARSRRRGPGRPTTTTRPTAAGRCRSLRYAVGDDRDVIDVTYSGVGAPPDDVIMTGNGGNPFSESGWTGWFDLDNGYDAEQPAAAAVIARPVLPDGRAALALGATVEESPDDFCNTQTDTSVRTSRATARARWSPWAPTTTAGIPRHHPQFGIAGDETGALVDLAITLGEPERVLGVPQPGLLPVRRRHAHGLSDVHRRPAGRHRDVHRAGSRRVIHGVAGARGRLAQRQRQRPERTAPARNPHGRAVPGRRSP